MSNISGNAYGAAAYQQANSWWNSGGRRGDSAKTAEARKEARSGKTGDTEQAKNADKAASASEAAKIGKTGAVTGNSNVKTSVWSGKGASQVPIPTYSKDYGTVIGDVNLSKEASDYYNKLKAKFGNMDFILVSKDQKAAVQANVSKYGNAKNMVVLIDDEKLERMATDKDFREKYEGIIAMAQNQLSSMKNDLQSSGASIKNFGMSVNSDGSTDYFAVLEKSNQAQAKRIEKKRELKAQEKKDAKKKADKKAREEKAEEAREKRHAEKTRLEEKRAEHAEKNKSDKDKPDKHEDVEKHNTSGHIRNRETAGVTEVENDSAMPKSGHERVHRSYTEFSSSSLEDLVSAVRNAAYAQSEGTVQTEAERAVGQSIDFRG